MLDKAKTEVTVDIIIAGGGTSGCVIGSRLAAAHPSLTILVIEAGPPTRDDLSHVQPARYPSHFVPDSTTIKYHVGKESKDFGSRSPVVACGQCFGGGSSVNAVYARPSASDFDDWEHCYGNAGWGSKDLIPLFQKMETFQVESHADTHGSSGPLKISYGGLFTNVGQQFLDVATKYDKTRLKTDDLNGMRESSINAYGCMQRWQKFIDGETGRRSDVAHGYIYSHDYLNLQVVTGYHVKRIIFEGRRAVGVEYLPNPRFQPDAALDVHLARSRRLVVVSAGPFGSPALLERSGIGAKRLMNKLGISTVVDLPGVGENFQDHIVTLTPYHAANNAETLDGIVRNDAAEVESAKLRPSSTELEIIGPEFSQRWKEYFVNAPDKPVMFLGSVSMYMGSLPIDPERKYFSMGYHIEYPGSRGYIHVTSADDIDAPMDFDCKFLTSPDDVAILRWGYKFSREIARRMPLYRGEFVAGHPQFSEGSQAVCHSDESPIAISAPNIKYTEDDDRAINEHIRKTSTNIWHSMGTCAMKPRGDGGVVDSSLNVYGVEGLKVADMSIAPGNVSANTCTTAIVIGEKAAAIILEELGVLE
ncbi:uncharacterized protein FIBRA_08150 [Fibroporia radiculosa]|uniref:Glucose-methanol-choline oxidoreductase N-terminal domain-containing protein n=1 Tax=Fibroporia radiculosa TaxID=599839 RepID=J4I2A0_9APHY|nr:uncharacterized protein FIBRA_08150 [Fibroporia radiculosa]CCM05912.1 predicted protein [Fibroporia radiculosa]